MQHGHDVHDDEQLVTHPEQVEDVAARRLRREHVHDADEQDEEHARETCKEEIFQAVHERISHLEIVCVCSFFKTCQIS